MLSRCRRLVDRAIFKTCFESCSEIRLHVRPLSMRLADKTYDSLCNRYEREREREGGGERYIISMHTINNNNI